MAHRPILTHVALMCLLMALLVPPAGAANTPYQTALTQWTSAASGFAAWQRDAVLLQPDGQLQLDGATAHPASDPYPAGGYNGHNFYNGGAFFGGEATSPVMPAGFGFQEAIASWNAATPPGT